MAKKIDENDEYGQKNLQKNLVIKDFGQKKCWWKKCWWKISVQHKFLSKRVFWPKTILVKKEIGESFSNKHDTVTGGSIQTNTFAGTGKGLNLGRGLNGGIILICYTFSKVLPSSAQAQAQAQLGLSWLYSRLIKPPSPTPSGRESFFSASAN